MRPWDLLGCGPPEGALILVSCLFIPNAHCHHAVPWNHTLRIWRKAWKPVTHSPGKVQREGSLPCLSMSGIQANGLEKAWLRWGSAGRAIEMLAFALVMTPDAL